MRALTILAVVAMVAAPAVASLVDTRIDTTPGGATVDGVISADEYGAGNSYSYTGAGTGFGGTVGNGTLYMESDGTNLYIGFEAGADVNDLVTIMLDTRDGGYTDAQMDDTGDGARRAISNLSANVDDPFDPSILVDFGLVLANWGSVLFETTTGAPLNYLAFDGNGSFPREYAIPLATLGVAPGGDIDFFVAYIADSGWGSNESIPAYEPLNNAGNPGFDGPSAGYGNFDRFTVVPEPSALLLLLAGVPMLRRRSA